MRKTLVIAVREYNSAVRTKAFIISIVLVPIFMFGSIIAVKLLEGQVDTTDKRIAVVDQTGQIADSLIVAADEYNKTKIFDKETKKKNKPAYLIEKVAPEIDVKAQQLALSNRVKNNQLYAFIEIGPDVIKPNKEKPEASLIAYHAENAAMDEVHRWIQDPINARIREIRLAGANLDQKTVDALTQFMPVETLGLVTVDESGKVHEAKRVNKDTAILPPLIMMMMMFMLVMMGAQPLLQSVLEEKMQRIAEVLLGSVSPFELMMGKLIGTVGVSLTVVGVYVAGGYFVADRVNLADHIPFHAFPWFFAYQVTAIFMFGAMYVAVGAACNDLKEAQSLMMPIMFVVMLPLFVWINVVKEPLSTFATWLSLFPPCTPMLMLIRIATPSQIPAWQPWAGLAGVLVFTVLSVWAAGRVFRVAILMQGKPPKIQDLVRWAIRG